MKTALLALLAVIALAHVPAHAQTNNAASCPPQATAPTAPVQRNSSASAGALASVAAAANALITTDLVFISCSLG